MEDRMELVPLNGSEPSLDDLGEIAARLDKHLAAQCDDLRSMLEGERQIIDHLQGLLDNHNVRVKRIQRALTALEGNETPAQKKTARQTAAKQRWEITDEKVEEIYGVLVEAINASENGTTTMTEARERVGSSASETYRKAVDKLRAQERIRVAGRTRGGGDLLALMPEGTHAA